MYEKLKVLIIILNSFRWKLLKLSSVRFYYFQNTHMLFYSFSESFLKNCFKIDKIMCNFLVNNVHIYVGWYSYIIQNLLIYIENWLITKKQWLKNNVTF
jgi:hypothetical protein